MGVVRDGIYGIYVFIWSLVKDAV